MTPTAGECGGGERCERAEVGGALCFFCVSCREQNAEASNAQDGLEIVALCHSPA